MRCVTNLDLYIFNIIFIIMNKAGIYIIKNIKNNKTYIGQTLNLTQRLKKHKYLLLKGRHHNKILQNSFLKYGIENFIFESIYEINIKNQTKLEIKNILNKKEIEFIIQFNSFEKGYNLNSGGNSFVVSEITKLKLKKSHQGLKPSKKCIDKAASIRKGTHLSNETKNKISFSLKNKKKNYSVWNKGKFGYKTKPASDERKNKIKISQLGNKNHNFGKKTSDSVKEKIRKSNQGELCYLSKLNNEMVTEIKKQLSSGKKGIDISKEFNISTTVISRIKNNKIWKHID